MEFIHENNYLELKKIIFILIVIIVISILLNKSIFINLIDNFINNIIILYVKNSIEFISILEKYNKE